jgi:DeoR family fructose operon transcriptional repressor
MAKTIQPLFAEERQEQILQLLKGNSKLLVPDLCEAFSVSPSTIRNDLRALSEKGLLKRTHGGAIPLGHTTEEPTYEDKEFLYSDEKGRITQYAASLISDGDTLAIDSGSTTFELVKLITNKKKLTIVLNDIKLAAYLEQNSTANIILLGGALRHGYQCTVGPLTLASLAGLNVDKAIMGCNAFSISKTFTTPDINHAEIKRAFIQSASQVFMLCDSSKFGKVTFAEFASLSDIDFLITDEGIPDEFRSLCADYKDTLELVVV